MTTATAMFKIGFKNKLLRLNRGKHLHNNNNKRFRNILLFCVECWLIFDWYDALDARWTKTLLLHMIGIYINFSFFVLSNVWRFRSINDGQRQTVSSCQEETKYFNSMDLRRCRCLHCSMYCWCYLNWAKIAVVEPNDWELVEVLVGVLVEVLDTSNSEPNRKVLHCSRRLANYWMIRQRLDRIESQLALDNKAVAAFANNLMNLKEAKRCKSKWCDLNATTWLFYLAMETYSSAYTLVDVQHCHQTKHMACMVTHMANELVSAMCWMRPVLRTHCLVSSNCCHFQHVYCCRWHYYLIRNTADDCRLHLSSGCYRNHDNASDHFYCLTTVSVHSTHTNYNYADVIYCLALLFPFDNSCLDSDDDFDCKLALDNNLRSVWTKRKRKN